MEKSSEGNREKVNVPMNTKHGVHLTRDSVYSALLSTWLAAVQRQKEPIDCGISEIIFFITFFNSILYAHFSNRFSSLSLDRSVKLIQMIPMNRICRAGPHNSHGTQDLCPLFFSSYHVQYYSVTRTFYIHNSITCPCSISLLSTSFLLQYYLSIHDNTTPQQGNIPTRFSY